MNNIELFPSCPYCLSTDIQSLEEANYYCKNCEHAFNDITWADEKENIFIPLKGEPENEIH